MKEISFITKTRQHNCPALWAEYRFLRNKVTSCINGAKKTYFNEVPHKYKNNSKKLWKELSRIVENKKKDNAVPQKITSLIIICLMNTSPISDQTLSNQCLILDIYHGKIPSVPNSFPLNQLEKAALKV